MVEDQDTRDTYGDDDDGEDEDSDGSDDSAWDEYEVRKLDFRLTQKDKLENAHITTLYHSPLEESCPIVELGQIIQGNFFLFCIDISVLEKKDPAFLDDLFRDLNDNDRQDLQDAIGLAEEQLNRRIKKIQDCQKL